MKSCRHLDESECIARAQRGDVLAFSELVSRHQDRIYRFLARLTRSPDDALDLTQETFLNAYQALGRWRPQARFSTWLFQIARNRLIDHWRKHGIHNPLLDSYDEQLHAQPDHSAGPEQQLSLSRDQARLDAALQGLPDDQREVFLLRLHGELEVPQIATLTGAPLETVKSRLRYAQQKLRRLLAEEIPA